MLGLWYYYTTGHFAFYINTTSTPHKKNAIRAHSHASAGIAQGSGDMFDRVHIGHL